MATKTVTSLVDDLDGSEADETVEFALDGVSYAVDLSAAHADDLRGELGAYISAARKVSGRAKRGTAPKARGGGMSRETSRAVRDWARQNGHEISDRGRIPGEVIEKFEAEHGKVA